MDEGVIAFGCERQHCYMRLKAQIPVIPPVTGYLYSATTPQADNRLLIYFQGTFPKGVHVSKCQCSPFIENISQRLNAYYLLRKGYNFLLVFKKTFITGILKHFATRAKSVNRYVSVFQGKRFCRASGGGGSGGRIVQNVLEISTLYTEFT